MQIVWGSFLHAQSLPPASPPARPLTPPPPPLTHSFSHSSLHCTVHVPLIHPPPVHPLTLCHFSALYCTFYSSTWPIPFLILFLTIHSKTSSQHYSVISLPPCSSPSVSRKVYPRSLPLMGYVKNLYTCLTHITSHPLHHSLLSLRDTLLTEWNRREKYPPGREI